MKLTERKLKILQALIDDYILTGVPVGSRTLSKRSDLGISSATIRNEMADLEEEGYLDQPHTSAGRTPSEKAYRLYVDTLMQVSQLNDQEISVIKSYFNTKMHKMAEIVDVTAKALSDCTKLVSVVMAPELSRIALKRIQLVKITERKALMLFVFSNGIVKDYLVSVPEDVSPDYFEFMSNVLSQAAENKTILEAAAQIKYVLGNDFEKHREFISNVLDVIKTNTEEDGAKNIVFGGAKNIFFHPEYQDVESAKNVLQLMETKSDLYNMLKRATNMEFSIKIGNENELDQLKGMSVITATYKIQGQKIGSFGVIGPTRMNYAKMLSVLSCIGGSMSEILTNYIETNNTD